MVAILETTFSNAFSWNMYVYFTEICPNWQVSIGSENGLASRLQVKQDQIS